MAKLTCTLCERVSLDTHLMCPRRDCPIELQPILGSGQMVGDLKVQSFVRTTRIATYYIATRNKQAVLLKIANLNCEQKLIEESKQFLLFTQKRKRSLARKGLGRYTMLKEPIDPLPELPLLLPAYERSRLEDFPYGQANVNGKMLFYEAFEYIQASTLREYLAMTQQPFFKDVAVLITSLAKTLYTLNEIHGVNHLCLNSETVWVREDIAGQPRLVLMDLGISQPINYAISSSNILWLKKYGLTAYLAPEFALMDHRNQDGYYFENTTSSDVYGLGVILYEMLAGQPKHIYDGRDQNAILQAIRTNDKTALRRPDIEVIPKYQVLLELANISTESKPQDRQLYSNHKPVYLTTKLFYEQLNRIINNIPKEKTTTSLRVFVNRAIITMALFVSVFALLLILIMP